MGPKFSRRKFLKVSAATGAALALPANLFSQTANPPRGKFDDDSTAEEVTRGLDLTGKTILVTGCNSGLGLETTRVLAMRGAHVLGAARTMAKAERAAAMVKGKVTPFALELTDFSSIVACAKAVDALKAPLDGLICNAGIMALPKLQVVNGVEKQFMVNYLGHFLLTQRLMPALKSAPQGRIVMVSSGWHSRAPKAGIEFNNLDGRQSYEPLTAYGQSKLAQALFCLEFARRFPNNSVTANSLHPGVISTNLWQNLPWYMRAGVLLFGWTFTKSVPEGAATQCYVAARPELSKVSGHYFKNCNPARLVNAGWNDPVLSRQLWDTSMKLTAAHLKG